MYQLGRFLRWAVPLVLLIIVLAVLGFRSCINNPPAISAPAATQVPEQKNNEVIAPAEELAVVVEEEVVVEDPEVVTVVTGDFPEDLFLTPVGSTGSFNS